MGIEVRPFGVRCNIGCLYCYQNPERDAGNVLDAYDLDRMKAALESAGREFTLFGGEPLIMPLEDLEALWAFGLERFGKNYIQTNGVLVNDDHVRLFHKYKVKVGVSVDGPGEHNDARWAGSLEKTREATAKTHAAIERLCKEGLPPSLIVTLHRANATRDKLPGMLDWVRSLEPLGVRAMRLHLLEVEEPGVRERFALSNEENLEAMRAFHALESELTTLKFDVFKDMRDLLLGQDKRSTCIWQACDPYTTKAVQGIEGTGQRSNCGRTNKDGIDFVKAGTEGFERYMALYQTPQEHGGCQGCRFFLMCKGQCPGTSIDQDWRNRTEHCEVWKGLFRQLEEEMLDNAVTPLSAHAIRPQLEQDFLRVWATGRNTTIANVLRRRKRLRKQRAEAARKATPAKSPTSPQATNP